MPSHPLWLALVLACVVWYCVLTVYVGIRGAFDIRSMLDQLRDKSPTDSQTSK